MGAKSVAGCDLGKYAAKFVVGEVDGAGRLTIQHHESVAHDGQPMEAFRQWYARREIFSCASLAATGLHADELILPVLTGLPEDACLEAALSDGAFPKGPVNLLSIGARGYAAFTRAADGRIQYLENDKCSSGTGETLIKIAGRFGLSIGEADRLAQSTTTAIAITARCSVFAKSEMTHFGNQGRSTAALFRGYFRSVANTAAALLARVRVDGPVFVIGGPTRVAALLSALSETLGVDVLVPARPFHLEAMGAAMLAGQGLGQACDRLPEQAEELIKAKPRRFRVLDPASDSRHRVTRLAAPHVPAGSERGPSILGLDLGSTGSKAVLTSIASGEAVLDVYDHTHGNPVDAVRRLVEAVLMRCDADVRAIGVTGSGREAAATVLRAAYSKTVDRIAVHNEIVAHATSAIRCDKDGGKSLSVVEIGGQDAKFIHVVDGQIVESDMNKACSAGTGSFLEEQAVFYGIEDIAEFTQLAKKATRPPDLGQMCTVFVADAAAEAHNEGFAREDLFGGFQYSVIHNYINRVMGQRLFGDRIFFQGKPASGESLAWTLAAVTGRDVVVPANPGAMGAWGVGLCVLEEHGQERLLSAAAFDLQVLLAARVVARSEFQCRDKECATLCAIEKTTVEIGVGRHSVMSGGACPKFEISSVGRPKLSKQAPSACDERAEALKPYLADRGGTHTIGVPMVGALYGYVPWLVTLLGELDLGVKVLRSDKRSLSRGEERCYSFDACAPVKIAHSVVDSDVDTVFLPKIVSLGDRDGPGKKTCPIEQGLPEMVHESLRARGRQIDIIRPALSLGAGLTSATLFSQLGPALLPFTSRPGRMWRAMRAAAAAQEQYEQQLADIGRRTLVAQLTEGAPVVVLCGSLHVIHDRAINAGIPQLLRENGVLVLPMDCLPIEDHIHAMTRIEWADASRTLRAAASARARGNAYPLLLTSFACGPMSFVEQTFAALMEGYPHTVLESDGHGGTAGYVTRVQAFLHAVRQHDGRPSAISPQRQRLVEPLDEPPLDEERDSRLVMLSVGDRVSTLLAANYRSFGYDAVASGPSSAETLALGRRDCSGKECVPYQLLWGAFRKHLEDAPSEKRTVLMQVSGQGMCRNCMFSIKDQLSLQRLGLDDKVVVRHVEPHPEIGHVFMNKQWVGLTVWDLFFQLASYCRPHESRLGAVDELYDQFVDELERVLETPTRAGGRGLLQMPAFYRAINSLVDRGSHAFRNVAPMRQERHLKVLLTGDIYVRIDPFASDSLTRRLNERGISVVAEPITLLAEYMAEANLAELFRLPTRGIDNKFYKVSMRRTREFIYKRAQKLHPWLPITDVRDVVKQAGRVLDRYPQGEAPVTIGSTLHHFAQGNCDGVVVASPWGCGPALVAESLLRHQRHIPMLFVYSDGTPIDERRLNAFAFRLKRTVRERLGERAVV